ncbi:uncharacterized protein LOC129950651 [Eupeodes corollae]|uniref:uncharacterized protein LOC129950651 n=1 Tax=Eupeodes corollae TaxID=290404 RepID=UPI0024904FDD|nr:uncharacterized protein LOC129950651 [Eupeodes corollae]
MPRTRRHEEEEENLSEEGDRANETMVEGSKLDIILENLKKLSASVAELKSETKQSQEEIERLQAKMSTANMVNAVNVPPNANDVLLNTIELQPDASEIPVNAIKNTTSAALTVLPCSPPMSWSHQPATSNNFAPPTMKLHDLPTFSGRPDEWPLFLANYEDSTADFNYNNRQNLQRLQKCLNGPAREAVTSMLINKENVPEIIEELKFRFGRPDILVRNQLQKIQQFPAMKQNKTDQILDYSTQVRNVVALLKASKSEHSLQNSIILEELVGKLPEDKQYEWVKHATTLTKNTTIEDFSKWLCQLARVVCLMPPPSSPPAQTSNSRLKPQTQPRRMLYVNNNASTTGQEGSYPTLTFKCYLCGDNHFISNCSAYSSLSVDDRWQKVKSLHLCFSCLRKGHSTANCRKRKMCGIQECRKYHHTSLHDESSHLRNHSVFADAAAQPLLSCRTISSTSLLFKVLPVTLFGPNGKTEVFAMFDEGSALTILEEEVASTLGLKGRSQPLKLQWYGQNTTTEPSKSISLEIRGEDDPNIYTILNCRTVRNVNLPMQTFNKSEHKHLEFLPLRNYKNARPSILIGLDNIHLGTSSTVVSAGDKKPVAMKTKLGWVACGPTNNIVTSTPTVLMIRHQDELHCLVQEYFAADNFGINPASCILESEDNQTARRTMETTTCRINKRFQTGLLWKKPKPTLPNSFQMAIQRLSGIENKMKHKPDFAQKYKDEMTKYIQKGYARKLQPDEINNSSQPVWYLPHFAVQSPHKPDKIRIVFDAAATVNNLSLNLALLKGPEQAKPLVNILFKFREGIIGVAADIREMFSQIQIRPEDQQAQRFLWRDGDETQPINHYVMVSMIFGAICSPCVAEYVKNLNAQDFQHDYPEAASAIINKHYVDDYVASFNDEKEAIRICKDVVRINNEASFELRNFTSNSKKLQNEMNIKSREMTSTVNMERRSTSEKVLGMFWNTASDTFEFKTKFHSIPKEVLEGSRPPTKRELLGIVMAIYDPYGLLAEFLLYLKILVRDTWKTNIAWDDELPPEAKKRWQKWWTEFQNIHSFHVHRCYSSHLPTARITELHVFVDANQVAFAAAAYLRIIHDDGIDVTFVCGKTRGAPQKIMSIPRLELQAGVLGVRLSKIVIRNHDIKISKITFWTDSKTLLYWIGSTKRNFKAFVAHRISEILTSSEAHQWRWTPTEKNSADVATRANGSPKFVPNSVWITGPEFLKQSEELWPAKIVEPLTTVSDVEEIKPLLLLQSPNGNLLINFKLFSSYQRLQRTMAYVIRATQKFRFVVPIEKTSNCFLTIAELKNAENSLCKIVQKEQYEEEIKLLSSSKPLTKKSSIYTLNPYLDERGILRIQGRLDEALYLPFQARRPILLPPKHPLSMLIMKFYHEKLHHQNSAVVLNEVRQKFWIPHPKMLLKLVRRKCQQCKIDRAEPQTPIMGQLPIDRVTPFVRPFAYTGVDLFGPLNVTIGRRREKRWGVIFTCLTVRAAHLELAENLSTDAFIICLRNFINRRGTPVRIRSDNGTNFIGAQKELKKEQHLFDLDRIESEATSRGIEWIFNCPLNPSSGGCWERSVLIEAENVINSRPLTDISLSTEDEEPLTPNHFLLGCVNSTQTPYPPDEKVCLRKQWKIALNLKDRLWRRWIVEYLPQLLKRPKWNERVRPLQINDFVLVCDPNQPRSLWSKGRVTKVFPAKDGQVRFAEVRTANTCIRRPASSLAVINLDGESQSDSRGEEC